ncbi:hypothetical protein [Rhizobium sp. WW_1]|jgi:hypothetical protein|uniref:hypothetical protein n=1 Tax=Rhizobium sp. WW_1 TaxID=1907375 RepID=UPI00068EB369|nr:hypothetical protein [Rhizobium sp. WW_1]RKD61655.1 flagellin-like hook-associated protein FlgL [Rhizobium sp. WW_1]
MKLFILVLNVIGFWLMADPAHADPIITMIATAIAKGGIGAFLIKTLVSTVLTLGVSLLQKAMQKKPEQETGVKIEVRMGDDLPMSFLLGKYATAGKRKYINTWGDDGKTPNAYLVDVLEIGCMPSFAGPLGLTSVWFDDQKCGVRWDQPHPDGRGYPVVEYRDRKGNDYLWIKYLDGTQGLDPYLFAKFGADPERPWLPSMIGRGCQLVIVTARYNSDFFSGVPAGVFEPHPLPLYDVRKDSTNGGYGSHRWGDVSTYEPSTNNAVVAYNIIRGIYYNDEWMFGGQNLAPHRLPASNWIAAANECDRQIDLAAGGTENQFRAGYEVTGDDQPLDVVDTLRGGCSGRLAENGGIFKMLVGGVGSPVYSFTDNEILVTKGQSYDPFPTLSATYNAVEATYPEPAEKWAMKDAPALYNADLEAEDGNRRLPVGLKFPSTPFATQVQRLMRAMILDYRRFRTHQFYLPPEAYALEANDVVAWSSTSQGYNNKKFIVVQIDGHPDTNQLVTLKEVDPSDHDWSKNFELPTTIGWTGSISAPPQPMQGWSVQKEIIRDANGVPRRPAIRVSCTPDLDDVLQVQVTVQLKASGNIVFDSTSYPYAEPFSWLVSGDWCLPSTAYQVRGKLIPYTNRPTLFSDWIDVTTDDTRLSISELTADIIAAFAKLQDWINDELPDQILENAQAILDEVQARVDAIASEESQRVAGALEASSRYRDLVREIASIRDYAADLANASYTQKEQLRQSLTARIGDVVANFTDQITVAVSANAALALRVTTIEAGTGSLQAQITQVDRARADDYQALSDRMSLQSAGTDNQFDPAANALWTFDTTVLGWTGNGNPTVANGFLRPADHATDPYVLSPTGLGVVGNASRQIRARIRRTGAPVWEGIAWWKAASDAGWDIARQLVLSAPDFNLDGVALVTFNMAWSGTIDQIRIDLSSAQTATDYFEFDWIAIGSPSPGASRAELAAEQQARASGDSANAQAITSLQAQLATTNGTVQANSTAIGSLSGTVTALGNTVSAQGQSLTSLSQTVDGKASIESVNQLANDVEALGGGVGITSIGQSVAAIRNSLLPQSMQGVDQDFANFLDKMNGQAAVSLVAQTLTSQITLTQTSLDILSQAVTQVQATLPGLATSAALTALTSRVTAAEDSITSQSQAITSIQAALPGKAEASALNSLSQTVSQQGNTLSSQGQAITSLQNSITGKADASALQSLQTTVNQQGVDIQSAASALTQVTATANGATADAKFKMEVVAGPAGYTQIGAQARYDSGSGYKAVGWYARVPADPNAPAGFYVQASQFGLIDNGAVPFAVSGGVTYLVNANIQYADIGTLQVGRSNIRSGSISRVDYNALGVAGIGTTNTPITGLTAPHGENVGACIVHSAFSLAGDGVYVNNVQQPVQVVISIWDNINNAYTAVIEHNFMGRSHFAHEFNFTPPSWITSTTFRFDVRVVSGSNVTANNRTIRILSLYGR